MIARTIKTSGDYRLCDCGRLLGVRDFDVALPAVPPVCEVCGDDATYVYPNQNVGASYSGRLHALDYGAHVDLLEEWNEVDHVWRDATVTYAGDEVLVEHPVVTGGLSSLVLAVYKRHGEGDLVELYVYDERLAPDDVDATAFFNYYGRATA